MFWKTHGVELRKRDFCKIFSLNVDYVSKYGMHAMICTSIKVTPIKS